MAKRSVSYGGIRYNSIKDLTNAYQISYSAVCTALSDGKVLEDVVDKLLEKQAKKLLLDEDYVESLNDYQLEKLYRTAGYSWCGRVTEDTPLSFRGVEKTYYQWSLLLDVPVGVLIKRSMLFKQPSKILGVRSGKWIGTTRRVKGLLNDKEYFKITNLRVEGDEILNEGEVSEGQSIYTHPLYSAWCRLKSAGDLCAEWSLSYKKFYSDLERSYFRGCSFYKPIKDLPLSCDNYVLVRRTRKAETVYKKGSKWTSRVWHKGRSVYLGSYDTIEEARAVSTEFITRTSF